MIRFVLFLLILLTFPCAFLPPAAFSADETITISTYYPAPYGIYKELRAQRIAIGQNYINSAQYCWAPNACTNQINTEADLVVEGRVGIGKTDPLVPLHIYSDTWQGNAVISGVSDNGLTYSSLLLSDDDSNYLANSWTLAHKKMARTIEEDDFHILRWTHPTARIDMVIDAPTGNVGIATGAPQARLDVAGGVKIGDDTATCNANKAGTLRYHAGAVQYCDGANWNSIGPRAILDWKGYTWPAWFVSRETTNGTIVTQTIHVDGDANRPVLFALSAHFSRAPGTPHSGGFVIHLNVDGNNILRGSLQDSVAAPNTGSNNAAVTILSLAPGDHVVRLVSAAYDGGIYNIHSFSLSAIEF